MKQPKFIICDNTLITGVVELHKDLVKKQMCTIDGGGFWHMVKEDNVMILYGTSQDFKRATYEKIYNAITTGRVSISMSKISYFHTVFSSLEYALQDYNNNKDKIFKRE